MKRFIVSVIFLSLIAAVATGCDWFPANPPVVATLEPILVPTATATPAPNILVVPSGTDLERRIVFREPYPQGNCDGNSAATSTLTHARSISYLLEVGQEFTVSADGTIGLPGVGSLAIGGAVASHYKVAYGQTDTRSSSLQLTAQPGTRLEHTILHVELWDVGTIVITHGHDDIRIPYRFPVDFRLEQENSVELICPSKPSSDSSISASATQIPDAQPATVVPPTETPTAIVPSDHVRLVDKCNEGAYSLTFNEDGTANVEFPLPEGYTDVYISSDPATVEFSSGQACTFRTQFVLTVNGLSWVKIRGVKTWTEDGVQKIGTTGCIFSVNGTTAADFMAQNEYHTKIELGHIAELYRVSLNGIERLQPEDGQPSPNSCE